MTGSAAMEGGPAVLVLDIGSSSVRASLYDRRGAALDPGPEARRVYRWRTDSAGAMEIAADELLEHVIEVLDAAMEHVRVSGVEVAAVGTAAFWHSLMGVDRGGVPLTAVYGWGDLRAAGEAVRLTRVADESEDHARTGCFFHPSYPSVKLLWLRRGEPERFRSVAGWISFAEYLEQRLFGVRRCSISMASATGLLDVHRLVWDGEWLDRLELPRLRLSELVDTDAPLTGLRPEFAERWPELAQIPWYPALGDGACANAGSGAVGRETPGLTIGTSAAIRTLWEAETVVVPPELWCYRLDRDRWVAGRALSNGGNALAYLYSVLNLPPLRESRAEAAALEPDAHGLTVLPFLVGERGPAWLRERRAAVVGLTANTPPAHLLRAWMEAVSYRLAEALARLENGLGDARAVVASGGAIEVHSSWAAILADVLGRPVVLPVERETTSRGAALVVLERLGWIRDLAEASPPAAETLEPDPDRHGRYRAAMERQHALETALLHWSEEAPDIHDER